MADRHGLLVELVGLAEHPGSGEGIDGDDQADGRQDTSHALTSWGRDRRIAQVLRRGWLASLHQPTPAPGEQEQQLTDAEKQHGVAYDPMIPRLSLADTRPPGAP